MTAEKNRLVLETIVPPFLSKFDRVGRNPVADGLT